MDYIKFLPVGNGDSILIRAGNKTVMTDVHYRSSEEHYDIKPEIKEACPSNHLHYFIVTHTDKDHVRGFDEIFHRGKPDKDWNGKILVDEIICTQYVLDLKIQVKKPKILLMKFAVETTSLERTVNEMVIACEWLKLMTKSL